MVFLAVLAGFCGFVFVLFVVVFGGYFTTFWFVFWLRFWVLFVLLFALSCGCGVNDVAAVAGAMLG